MIDRNYAPDGYIAIASNGLCRGCEFNDVFICRKQDDQFSCNGKFCHDKTNRIYKRRPTIILNTTGKAPKAPEWATEARVWFRSSLVNEILETEWSTLVIQMYKNDTGNGSFKLGHRTPIIATEYR